MWCCRKEGGYCQRDKVSAYVRGKFNKMDLTNTGTLSATELQHGLTQMGVCISVHTLKCFLLKHYAIDMAEETEWKMTFYMFKHFAEETNLNLRELGEAKASRLRICTFPFSFVRV